MERNAQSICIYFTRKITCAALIDHVFVAILVNLVLLILLVLVLLMLPGSFRGRGVGGVGTSSTPLWSQVLEHGVGVLRQHPLLEK